MRRQARRGAQAHRAVGQGHAHPGEGSQRGPHHGERARLLAQLARLYRASRRATLWAWTLLPDHALHRVAFRQVATGTGIAPYRAFIRRLFVEKTPFGQAYKGLAWLFLGVANTDALLYDDEWQEVLKSHPENFRLDYALSREQTNVDGGKMYIQDKVKEYSDEIFDRMDKGAHMYFCGLKGMMPGITEMLEGVCTKKGLVFEEKLKEWKKAGQWHVEVY